MFWSKRHQDHDIVDHQVIKSSYLDGMGMDKSHILKEYLANVWMIGIVVKLILLIFFTHSFFSISYINS